MFTIKLSIIGVPTNSSGRRNGVAGAPAALRQAGLLEAVGRFCDAKDEGDVVFSKPSTVRDDKSGIIAHDSLASMIVAVRNAVAKAMQEGRFPLVIGGDCPVLLGCLKANDAGLLFVDGHEDAYPAHQSPTGEAADMELGFALGLYLPRQLQKAVGPTPLIKTSRTCIMGARDKTILENTGVKSLDGVVAEFYSDSDLRQADIADRTGKVLQRLAAKSGKVWLHVDLDVLSTRAMPAIDYPQRGGLSWKQLEQLVNAAMSSGRIIGCDVTIYNPDMDPVGRHAKRIVRFIADTIKSTQ